MTLCPLISYLEHLNLERVFKCGNGLPLPFVSSTACKLSAGASSTCSSSPDQRPLYSVRRWPSPPLARRLFTVIPFVEIRTYFCSAVK